jgi:hypothetical protein
MPDRPALEIEFDDNDTALLVDGEARPRDERLVRLLGWWRSISSQSLAIWSDDHLLQLGFVHDLAHVHEIELSSGRVRARFVGPALVRLIGEDPTGHWFSEEQSPSKGLRPTARRTYELVRLAQRMQAPLRARSKAARVLQGRKFMAENLHLPFAGADAGFDVVLAATVYTPEEPGAPQIGLGPI